MSRASAAQNRRLRRLLIALVLFVMTVLGLGLLTASQAEKFDVFGRPQGYYHFDHFKFWPGSH